MQIFNVAVIMIVNLFVVECHHHHAAPRHITWDVRRSGQCNYEGYAPGGGVENLGEIKAPVAELRATHGFLGVLTGVTKNTVAALKVVALVGETVGAVASTMAPILGIFGAVLGGLTSADAIKPKEILKSVNDAMAVLTDRINQNMERMKGYVDEQIVTVVKDLIERDYKTYFRMWSFCAKQPTVAKCNECQRDSYFYLQGAQPKFAIFPKELKTGDLSDLQVREIEVYLLPYRDYVNLVIMELVPLIKTYCTDGHSEIDKKYCQLYSTSLVDQLRHAIFYCKRAYAAIIRYHKKEDCAETLKCTLKNKQKYVNYVKCHCVMDKQSDQICKCDGTVRWRYEPPNYNACLQRMGQDSYTKFEGEVVAKYWKDHLLSFIPTWETTMSEASVMAGDGTIATVGEPSPRAAERLAAAEEYVRKTHKE